MALALLSIPGGATAARLAAEPAREIVGGMALDAALTELQSRGLKLVWSSATVGAGLVVRSAPSGDDPRAILDQILAPHGLAVEPGAAGTLVVVPSSAPQRAGAVLRGTVRSRLALAAVPGALVSVGPEHRVKTDAAGRFELASLAPGGYSLEVRRPGFVVELKDGVQLEPGKLTEIDVLLQPAPLAEEQITVHPSRLSLLDEQSPSVVALGPDEIRALPQLGGDVFRSLTLLPGTAGNDWTAQVHVRGGRRDEVLVLLDGQELYDAYHLDDYDNALSAVPAATLASLSLTTGGFGSTYGDRMGGVLDMATRSPERPVRWRTSLSVLDAQVEGGGGWGGPTSWLLSARRGSTDLTARLFGKEDPRFWDLLAKVDRQLGPSQLLRASLLHAADRLRFSERPDGQLREFDTRYTSSYAWVTHQAVLTDRSFVDSALSASRIERDRRGREDEEEKRFDVADARELEVLALLQSWNLQAGARHFLRAGFELRRFTADYDYASFREFESPFARLRAEPRDGAFDFLGELEDDYLGAYLSDRFQASDALTVELGLRHDRHTLTDDSLPSPRASLAWAVGGGSALRLSWGLYRQSQRAYELAVEDGDTALYRAERAEHWVAGFEHRFLRGGANGPQAYRIEVYRRRLRNPRPRYENLFEPFEPFDEGELDRVRIEPDRSESRGVELFLRGRAGERIEWWINYSLARSEDQIEGVHVPRQIDQRHTLNADLNVRLPHHWSLNLAWRFHSGRPTTPVSLVEMADEEGESELVPELGRLNSERLPAEHRLDLRLSRAWLVSRGRLTFFFDAQNLYDRKNVAGFDLEIDEEAGTIVAHPESWPGFFASAGIGFEF